MASIKISQLTHSQRFHDSFLRELTDVESRTLKGGTRGIDVFKALGLGSFQDDNQQQQPTPRPDTGELGDIVAIVLDGVLYVGTVEDGAVVVQESQSIF